MSFLASGANELVIPTGDVSFSVSTWPLVAELPVSYEASDPPLPSDEDEEGNIVPSADLDDHSDDLVEETEVAAAEQHL